MANITIETLKPKIGTIQIKHPVTGVKEFDLPDGSKGPLEIQMVGRNSTQWLDFMKKIANINKEGKVELFSKISEESHEFVASLIVGWTNNGAIDEPYSAEAAISLITNPLNIWILEQLQAFLLEEQNFFLVTLEV